MKQEQTTKHEEPKHKEAVTGEAKDLRNEELNEAVDDLLEEIDEVLEANSEEFVSGFQQKGGE